MLGYDDPSHVDVVDLLIKCADTDGNGEVSIDEVSYHYQYPVANEPG